MVLILVTEMALVTEMSGKALTGVVLYHGASWKTRGLHIEGSPEGTAAFGGPGPFPPKPSSSAQHAGFHYPELSEPARASTGCRPKGGADLDCTA